MALAALLGCGGGAAARPPALPALGGITSVLRLPAEGGTALAYSPDSLQPLQWQSGRGLPALERLLGYDLDSRIVWAVDTRRRLVGLDLETGRALTAVSGVRDAVVGPDGAAFVVDSAGRVVRLQRQGLTVLPARYPVPPAAMFGTQDGQVLAVQRDDSAQVRLLSSDRPGPAVAITRGPVTATFWGELLAVADGREVSLVRSSDGTLISRVTLSDPATALAFSPSGHRLYALESDRIQWYDRFSGGRLGTLQLAGPADGFRMDASGRWLLVRPLGVDSVWMIDMATAQPAGTIATGWRNDLPTVAGSTLLLALSGADVIGYSLAATPAVPTARVVAGGNGFWLPLPWVPPGRIAEVAATLAEAQAIQDSGLVDLGLPAEEVWLQISSSQNADWAEDLARQLANDGFPSDVWPPRTPEDGFRVVVGPFQGRSAAEEAGRRLDRPFFVVTLPAPR